MSPKRRFAAAQDQRGRRLELLRERKRHRREAGGMLEHLLG